MKFKIAVVQFEIKQFSPRDNLIKAEKFIKKAAKSNVNIIVFPEDFITGPLAGDLRFADSKKIYRRLFQKFAKEYKIDIVAGSFVERNRENYYNTCYYIGSDGKIISRYRKINLWHPEKRYLSPGKEISVFKTKYGKIGLIICWDFIFPEIFRRMVRKGVSIVICPSYWCYGDAGKGIKYDIKSETKLVDALCVGRAFENEIVFVYCNAAGKMKIKKYRDTLIGHSQITVPFKGMLKKFEHNKEGMLIQVINTNILKDAEKAYRIRGDIKNKN